MPARRSSPNGPAGSLTEDLRTIYGGELSEFIEHRTAAAARRKGEGNSELAKKISKLAKPNQPAWAINQIFYEQTNRYAELIAAGQDLRSAQAGASGSSALAEVTAASARRRKTIDALTEWAQERLERSGHAASRDALNKVRQTLEALSSRDEEAAGEAPLEEQAGSLTRPLTPPDFDGLLGAMVAMAGAKSEKGTTKRKRETRKSQAASKKAAAKKAATKKKSAEAADDKGTSSQPQKRKTRSTKKRPDRHSLQRRQWQAQLSKAEKALAAEESRTAGLGKERKRLSRALERRDAQVEKQREKLQVLERERAAARRAHDDAKRAHRRSELERLKIEKRIQEARAELDRLG